MNKSFIEVYDNVLPDDICDYLISIFDREHMMPNSGVKEVRTVMDPTEGETNYVSALDMRLWSDNYMYNSIINDLDFVLKEKIFDYNKK